jgi:hypothetical protein
MDLVRGFEATESEDEGLRTSVMAQILSRKMEAGQPTLG